MGPKRTDVHQSSAAPSSSATPVSSVPGTPKSAHLSSVDESVASWSCPRCTLLNEGPSLECAACGLSKPQAPPSMRAIVLAGFKQDGLNTLFVERHSEAYRLAGRE